MKRTTVNRCVLLTLTLALSAIPFSGRATTPHERYAQCRYQAADGRPGYSPGEVRSEIGCALRHYPVPGGWGTVYAIALRETGGTLNPFALNRYSGACGILQDLPSLWPGRVAAYRSAHPKARIGVSCFNARSNVVINVWLMHAYGLGPWR